MLSPAPRITFSTARDGYRFAVRVWEVAQAKGTIVVLHGIVSHGGWYLASAAHLAKAGFEVHLLERRGSGLNPADRGDVDRYQTWLADVEDYLEALSAKTPRILLGISWGGTLAAAVARHRPELLAGVGLLCPGLYSRKAAGALQRAALRAARVLGLAGSVSVVCWILYVPVTVRIFGEAPWLCARRRRPLKRAEECRFPTADGLVLRGSYLPTTLSERRAVILFCHELFGDRWGALPYVEDLRKQGFDIFTFDFRNHGASDRLPGYEPLPWLTRHELTDVRAAVDYLCTRVNVDRTGIGLIGVSKGADAALCAAAEDPRVTAVVSDSAFPVGAMQRYYIRRFMRIYCSVPYLGKKLPDWSLTSLCVWARFLVGLRDGCKIINVDRLAGRVRQPVFMIHGKEDRYVPRELVRRLRRRLAGRSTLWVVPGVRHNGAITAADDVYKRRVGRFFRTHLGDCRTRPEEHRTVRLGRDQPGRRTAAADTSARLNPAGAHFTG